MNAPLHLSEKSLTLTVTDAFCQRRVQHLLRNGIGKRSRPFAVEATLPLEVEATPPQVKRTDSAPEH